MNMADRDGLIWFDGKMVNWRDANVHVLTHTLHYGMGVFEGVRAYETDKGAAIFKLQEHTERLFNSAKIMQMNIPFDKQEINDAQIQSVLQNNLSSAYIRPMCFYGSESMGLRAKGLKTHCIIAAWNWGSYMGEDKMQQGIRIKTSSHTRHHVNISMCKSKTNGNYVNSMLALQEALNDGYDEAMLLDPQGFVAEGSGENIFIIKNDVIYTPDSTSALNGITRQTIMNLATDIGIKVIEKRITRDEVYIADEAFFSGTAVEITPISEVDNRPIGTGTRGQITKKLQQMFFDVVNGKLPKYDSWLSYVEA
ncbi:MAG: branched chain amino acid aminotransferase [Gammaproteobacteria bacterium]|nr:MAG: branched chain amino acid aminotransferase [Gammaproteobacteria bacterium]